LIATIDTPALELRSAIIAQGSPYKGSSECSIDLRQDCIDHGRHAALAKQQRRILPQVCANVFWPARSVPTRQRIAGEIGCQGAVLAVARLRAVLLRRSTKRRSFGSLDILVQCGMIDPRRIEDSDPKLAKNRRFNLKRLYRLRTNPV